jgi:hypothetical protein
MRGNEGNHARVLYECRDLLVVTGPVKENDWHVLDFG